MISTYTHELYKKLLEDGFEVMPNSYPLTEIGPDTRFITLTKEVQSSFHVVLIANMDVLSIFEFNAGNKDLIKFLEGYQQRGGAKNLFVTNMMLVTSPSKILDAYIGNLDNFMEGHIANIFWCITVDDFQVHSNPKHPNKVLNLRKILETSHKAHLKTLKEPLLVRKTKFVTELHRDVAENLDLQYWFDKISTVPHATYVLMLINLVVLLVMELMGGSTNVDNLIRFGAIHPDRILNEGEFYRLLSATFLHIGVAHLAVNMLSLYIFGTRVERYYGRVNFLWIYTLAGLVGSLFSVFLSSSISAGASGAILGLVGASAVLTKVKDRVMDGLNYNTMSLIVVVNIGFGLSTPGVDNWGHIGGLIGGAVVGYAICKLGEVNFS